MTDKHLYVEVPPFFVNQSRWKTHQDCDRLYGWIYVEGIIPDRPVAVLETGTAVHAAQVVAHEGGGTESAFDDAVSVAETHLRSSMKIQLPGDEAELQNALKIVRKLLPAYRQHYAGQGQLWKPLGQELKFCVEVGEETGVFLVGRIDNLVTFMNALWLVDYKTMGRLDMRDFLKYELDVQLTAYIYGGTKQLSLDARERGEPPVIIRGAIIDGMVKTDPPQFHREMYTRTIEDLRQFEVEFVMKAWEMASKHAMVRKDKASYDYYVERMYALGSTDWKIAFPMNTQHCFRYRTCTHRDLCAKDTEVRRVAFTQRRKDYVDEAVEKSS